MWNIVTPTQRRLIRASANYHSGVFPRIGVLHGVA